MIDLTGDSVTPQTLFEGATAHDKSGAPISGAVAVAPPSTMTPSMDGTASTGTETAYARGDHRHPSDTTKLNTTGGTIKGDLLLEPPSAAAVGNYLQLIAGTTGSGIYSGKTLAIESYDGVVDLQSCLLTNIASPLAGTDATNKKYVDARTPDVQTQGNWRYKVYADGTFEAWYKATGQSITITAQSGNLYRSDAQTITLPTAMTSGKTCNIQHVSVNAAHNNYPAWGMLASIQTPTANTFKYYAMSGGSRTASPNYTVTAYVFGTLE